MPVCSCQRTVYSLSGLRQSLAFQRGGAQFIDDEFEFLLGFAVELQRGFDMFGGGAGIGGEQVFGGGELHACGVGLLFDGVVQVARQAVALFDAGQFIAGVDVSLELLGHAVQVAGQFANLVARFVARVTEKSPLLQAFEAEESVTRRLRNPREASQPKIAPTGKATTKTMIIINIRKVLVDFEIAWRGKGDRFEPVDDDGHHRFIIAFAQGEGNEVAAIGLHQALGSSSFCRRRVRHQGCDSMLKSISARGLKGLPISAGLSSGAAAIRLRFGSST